MMNHIKQKWFEVLDQQHQSEMLNEKIIGKLSKVSDVQEQMGTLIDEITFHIDQNEVDEVDGESSDMMIQKQIATANQLISKVNNIKDKMDKGEYDGKTNMNSILDSSYDNDLGGSMIKSENDNSVMSANNESFEKALPSKKKGKKQVVRRETNLSSRDQSIRSTDF